VELVLPKVEVWHQWDEAGDLERGRSMKKCAHICVNAKMIHVETIPGIREEEKK
jgi:hypothetical protein